MIRQGHTLSTQAYVEQLKQSPRFDSEIRPRIPEQCWEVIRRECPYGKNCPHLREWGVEPSKGGGFPVKHYHIWCFPENSYFISLTYRKDLFAEENLPEREPEDWSELLAWARKLTDPPHNKYGFVFQSLNPSDLAWCTNPFLYSAGGRVMQKDAQGQWQCTFNSDEAVEAYYFVARLFLEHLRCAWAFFLGDLCRGPSAGRSLL